MWTGVELHSQYARTVNKQHVEISYSVVAFTCAKRFFKKAAKQKNVVLVMVREKRPSLDSCISLEWRSVSIIKTKFQVAF